jgi:hypothetical protein
MTSKISSEFRYLLGFCCCVMVAAVCLLWLPGGYIVAGPLVMPGCIARAFLVLPYSADLLGSRIVSGLILSHVYLGLGVFG